MKTYLGRCHLLINGTEIVSEATTLDEEEQILSLHTSMNNLVFNTNDTYTIAIRTFHSSVLLGRNIKLIAFNCEDNKTHLTYSLDDYKQTSRLSDHKQTFIETLTDFIIQISSGEFNLIKEDFSLACTQIIKSLHKDYNLASYQLNRANVFIVYEDEYEHHYELAISYNVFYNALKSVAEDIG